MSAEERTDACRVTVENIGGIDETSVTFSPGVTVLAGRNATNRTSLLRAIMTVCGSDRTPLKADADRGEVVMEIDGETYRRELERVDDGVVSTGDPYLEDPELADLFAFLLESNEGRRAVTQGTDLRELLMRPVDTERIRSEIDRLMERKRQLDEELGEIDALKRDLPQLETERSELTSEIDRVASKLEAKEAEVEAASGSLDGQQRQESRLQGKMDTLSEKRSTLDDIRYEIETKEKKLDALHDDRHDLTRRRESLSQTELEAPGDIEDRIDTLRQRRQQLETELNDLQSIVQFNERMLAGTGEELLTALVDDEPAGAGALTDQLVTDDTITCWTCQSTVDRTQVESTVETLRDHADRKRADIDEITDELETLTDALEEFHGRRRERERIDRQLDDLEEDIEHTEAELDRLRERRETVRADIRDIEAEIEELETEQSSRMLQLHKEANELEYELGRLESERDDLEAELARKEARLEDEPELQAERDRVDSEITDRRTEIERIETEAVEAFNEHMAEVLDLLEYDNLERIWIERTERRDSSSSAPEATFELHVVRSTASGTTYEDTVDHLSESEREVTGLVFALAGYLVHDVHEVVPFMLLDSLEALDSERISRLVEYFGEYSRYLVVALLPEDARALDDCHTRTTDI